MLGVIVEDVVALATSVFSVFSVFRVFFSLPRAALLVVLTLRASLRRFFRDTVTCPSVPKPKFSLSAISLRLLEYIKKYSSKQSSIEPISVIDGAKPLIDSAVV